MAENAERWLKTKLQNYYPDPQRETLATLAEAVTSEQVPAEEASFDNPFCPEDLLIFDEETRRDLLIDDLPGLEPGHQIRGQLLDHLFWELTYWKTPELYEELIEGERLHPDLFRQLRPDLRGKTILDAGAGSGRATFACLRQGAQHIYAVEPSPGLLRLLAGKLARTGACQITPLRGRFDRLPLEAQSVDTALACSAFTAEPGQGGEAGLAELQRVTRRGGQIILIWPRPQDYRWLAAHGFHYVALPMPEEPRVRFRSWRSAWRVARRFYARNPAVTRHLLRERQPEVPFSLLGPNPPHDYCWRRV